MMSLCRLSVYVCLCVTSEKLHSFIVNSFFFVFFLSASELILHMRLVPTVNMQQTARPIQSNVRSCCDQRREFAFEYMYSVLYFL